ncbi:polysaccharide monooxygenase Cel61a [Colletotrichum spaethianum]|uniref:lytic cellulose monooxygenase (C4-dehydrogenating) n=1 Tax=Colletotrichum spaethianum TaxID=700344 RepID=A0AA37PHQ6_9PEZI|nr:polysaccharide monooxygenase Cel61a [Colletotrichum spaethianum]GKT52526.1 polysaccharide monooxygenase Cel61a [Colletotrichum spaethianum]
MKFSAALTVLAIPLAQCHYIFSQLIVNGNAVGGDYTYMRKNSNSYNPSFTDEIVNSPELRCNKGATTGTAQTYTVAAGSNIGFKLWYNEFIEHPGPGFVYMSKVSGSLNGYDGSGDWFKVYETGLCGDRIEFTIPNRIPPGDYLVRVEHIGLHEAHVGKAQFHMECAHLKITGSGGGAPGPLVKIPGIYKATDPGIAYNKWTNSPAQYVMPGPQVWVDNGSSSPPPSAPPPSSGGSGAPLYGQCGGQGWTGPTTCAQVTCKVTNEWYSQCV